MPSYVTQLVRGLNNFSYSKNLHLPMLNDISMSVTGYLNQASQIGRKKALMRWYKSIPELTALVNKVANDIVYKWHFESVNPSDSGRNKVLKANRFAKEVKVRETMLSQVIDILVTGEGFGWIGKIEESKVKEAIFKHVSKKQYSNEMKQYLYAKLYQEVKATEGFADTEGIDEDLLKPRKYRYVPSSTVEIVYDQYDIKGYNQIVYTHIQNPEFFTPEEMVHYSFMNIDGKVNGFTPVESVVVQLELLRQMWQNMLALQKNGGHPDKIFSLENMRTSDPNFARIQEQLMKYKLAENKHGIMLFTGKMTVQDLNSIEDMQFKDMGLYITGLMAMQWQIPRSSIPYIIGSANTKDDTGGNSEKGYWRKIEYAQMIYADIMNTQLWIPFFGVQVVFDNTFIQQDVQLQTAKQLRLNNLVLEDQILSKHEKMMSYETLLRDLGRSDIETTKAVMMENTQSTMNQQLSQSDMQSDEKRNVSARKKAEQDNLASSNSKPNGSTNFMTKEWDDKAEMEFKETIGENETLVDVPNFVKLYNQDKAYSSGMPPRIFMRQNLDFTSLKFKSSDFVYKVVIPNSELENHSILLSNLSNIYRL